MPEIESSCGWVKLYHSRGVLVTVPIPVTKADYGVMFANVNAAFDAGFLANAPGLGQGEERLEITSVARMSQVNRDQSESPMIALYEHGNAFKSITVYLDTEQEIAAFVAAAGLRTLQEIPLLDGTVAPECGKSKKIIALTAPMGVIVKQNPKYDPARAAAATQSNPYTVPKRVFVRWFGEPAPVAAAPATQPQADGKQSDDEIVATWTAFLKTDPSVTDLNARIREKIAPMSVGPLRTRCWNTVKAHAEFVGLEWSKEVQGFTPAKA